MAGFEGVVQTMNPRSTILLTIDDNHAQIPNESAFKRMIVNYTAAPSIGSAGQALMAQCCITYSVRALPNDCSWTRNAPPERWNTGARPPAKFVSDRQVEAISGWVGIRVLGAIDAPLHCEAETPIVL